MVPLRVAVTTHSPTAVLRECLEALATARGILVLSGPDAPPPEAVPDGFAVEREPRPGASHARNRALASCEDREVIAFVDDDAVPDPEFLASLVSVWERADTGVACVAGRIDLRLPGPAPSWFAPELRTVFSELDLGPQARDLDPAVNFAYGPNMSFRAGALRAAGGFDPAFGPGPGRPGFAEEQEAQLALARLGHRIRWEPAPRVEHVVAPEAFTRAHVLRRRFAYGRSLGARGARPASLAARRSLANLGGAAAASMRSDHPRAMVRAMRAAENIGALLGRG